MPFDDFWYDDFDGDGKISESDKFYSDWMFDDLAHSWRKEVDDGSEYGLDPRDFEFRESYEKALDEAKHEWRATAEFSFDLDPEDYETEEEYNAALEDIRKGRTNDGYKHLPREVIAAPGINEDTAGPTEERNASAAIQSARKQRARVSSRKIRPGTSVVICVAVVLCVILSILIGIGLSDTPENADRQDYTARIKKLCASYGLTDPVTSIMYERTGRLIDYDVTVTVQGLSDLDYQEQYELVKKIEDMEIEHEDYITFTSVRIVCGGRNYRISYNDEYTLQIDYKDVYVDEQEAERRFREEIKRKEVYVGLPEEYISMTADGPYDEVEYCEGFDGLPAKDRTVTYKWYFDDGVPWFNAVVGYWDSKTETETDGTVIRVDDIYLDNYWASKSASTAKKSITTPAKKTTTSADPYDVDDYSDPDEFYYYHYDDFFDYEDAEDYFYDHAD